MNHSPSSPPRALTIAGSDSGGSAGLQADLKTFEARGVFGTSVVTLVTAQNTLGVLETFVLPESLIRAQIEAVLSDIGAGAIKTGLLARSEVITLVAETLRPGAGEIPLVVDPVLVNGQGQQIVTAEAVQAYRERLFPLATVITPNTDEAALLTGLTLRTRDDLYTAARSLHDMGARAVIVKGGHLPGGESIVDVVYDGVDWLELRAERLPVANPHGVGCTFAAALAAELAKGHSLPIAAQIAHRYVQEALHGSLNWQIGQGRSPVNHAAGRVIVF